MYCLCFIDSSSLEHLKWLCVALSVSPGLFSAVGGSCLLWFGGGNRILTFLLFWTVAWKGCGVLSVRYNSKAVCFLCCIVRPGFTDSHQSYAPCGCLSGTYLIRHLQLSPSRAGQAGMWRALHRSQKLPALSQKLPESLSHVCDGMECSEHWQRNVHELFDCAQVKNST